MKLSVWSAYYIDLSPEDALRELKKHGYDYCELSDEHALALLERGNAKEIGKKFGTKLSGKATIFGGIILILIGIEIFVTGVFF